MWEFPAFFRVHTHGYIYYYNSYQFHLCSAANAVTILSFMLNNLQQRWGRRYQHQWKFRIGWQGPHWGSIKAKKRKTRVRIAFRIIKWNTGYPTNHYPPRKREVDSFPIWTVADSQVVDSQPTNGNSLAQQKMHIHKLLCPLNPNKTNHKAGINLQRTCHSQWHRRARRWRLRSTRWCWRLPPWFRSTWLTNRISFGETNRWTESKRKIISTEIHTHTRRSKINFQQLLFFFCCVNLHFPKFRYVDQ